MRVVSCSLLLSLPSLASATDLAAHVEAWSVTRTGQGGSDEADEAFGVGITSALGVLAVGSVDGAAGHGHDAFALQIAPDQSVTWEETTDSGALGGGRVASEDRWNAVAIDPSTDDVAFCGVVGAETPASDPPASYRVEGRLAGNPPTEDWTLTYEDGTTSDVQECRGVWLGAGITWASGWSLHGADQGRWLSFKLDDAGIATIPPVVYDNLELPQVPDIAHAVSVHTSGEVTVVGERGVAAPGGGQTNDTDWHVRHYDTNGALMWQATLAGAADLEDRALGVVTDPATGDPIVVGYVNDGTNNGTGADNDWVIKRYTRQGNGTGAAVEVWSTTWESAAGADEGATAVAIDDVGDLLVAGWSKDAASGKDRWRVGKLSLYDGYPREEWLGPVGAGDARPNAIAFRTDLVAIAGYVVNGAGDRDFSVTLLDLDEDTDGVANSVDACPTNPTKTVDEGVCGCEEDDVDTDEDGLEDCLDECPADPTKTEPGICGCGDQDLDSDSDGTYDCDDSCPDDPEKVDVGECGCNAPDTDTDGDGVLGCRDACSNTPPGSEVDVFGCPPGEGPGDTGDTGSDTPTDEGDGDGGCGCSSPGPDATWLAFAPLALVALRRRRDLVRNG